jgi:hypothetical protein
MPRINFGTEEKKEETKTKKPMNAIGYYILVGISVVVFLSSIVLGLLVLSGNIKIVSAKLTTDEIEMVKYGSAVGFVISTIVLGVVMGKFEPKKTGEETKTTTA